MRGCKFFSAILLAILLNLPAVVFAQEGGGLADYGAYESSGFAGGIFVDAICDLYSLVGGELGALLTISAIVTGLVAAAAGGFSSLRSAVIVGVSAFAMTSAVSLYFGTFTCSA